MFDRSIRSAKAAGTGQVTLVYEFDEKSVLSGVLKTC